MSKLLLLTETSTYPSSPMDPYRTLSFKSSHHHQEFSCSASKNLSSIRTLRSVSSLLLSLHLRTSRLIIATSRRRRHCTRLRETTHSMWSNLRRRQRSKLERARTSSVVGETSCEEGRSRRRDLQGRTTVTTSCRFRFLECFARRFDQFTKPRRSQTKSRKMG